jgi:uncharacterized protein (DUF58 family)
MSWHQRIVRAFVAGIVASLQEWRRPVATGLLTVLFATVTPHGLTTYGWVFFGLVLYLVIGMVIAEARRQLAAKIQQNVAAARRHVEAIFGITEQRP